MMLYLSCAGRLAFGLGGSFAALILSYEEFVRVMVFVLHQGNRGFHGCNIVVK